MSKNLNTLPESLSPLKDGDAKWRILAQLKTLTNDRANIFEPYFGCGRCHLCDVNTALGVTKTASGVEWHRDLVHFVEIHNLRRKFYKILKKDMNECFVRKWKWQRRAQNVWLLQNQNKPIYKSISKM